MDPPPPPQLSAAVAPQLSAYPDSAGSSPRSRNTDSWDDQSIPATAPKLRLMCSYGGRIVPRPHDKSLCYVGGDTRMVVVDRHTTLSDLTRRLSKTLLNNTSSFSLKYQLPNEDLDSLISVTTDEDVDNMIEEHDRLLTTAAQKSSRLRLFLFPSKSDSDSVSSIGSLLGNSTKSDDWFLSALNGTTTGFSDSASMNCLLGLGDDVVSNSSAKEGEVRGGTTTSGGKFGGAQDVQSVPDSPMMEKNSSFGSTSSSPSLANLPLFRVHVDDQKAGVVGEREIEEQFGQMTVGAKQDHRGVVFMASQPTVAAASGVPVGTTGEYQNWVFSYDERSEQGIPIVYPSTQPQPQPQPMPPQLQLKTSGGLDLASESVSSDGSIPNQLSRERPMIYQDPVAQINSRNNRIPVNPVNPNLSDPNSRVHIQQQQHDSGYVLVNQFDQQHQQMNPQQQQFVQAGTHYIHHHPTGAVPITSYYPIYPSQQQQQHHPHHQLEQQYPVYYVPAREPQAYNLSVQQSSYSEDATAVPSSQHLTTSHPAMIPASAAVYKMAAAAAPPLVQVPSSQHQHQPQYVGFSQIHYPSQSVAPPAAATATANYAYQFADPAHSQVYYTQPLAPEFAAQYQTMTSAPAAVLPEASDQLPTDHIKQQIRTSQA